MNNTQTTERTWQGWTLGLEPKEVREAQMLARIAKAVEHGTEAQKAKARQVLSAYERRAAR